MTKNKAKRWRIKKAKTRSSREAICKAATAERGQHNPLPFEAGPVVELAARQAPDTEGKIGAAAVAHDTLSLLVKRGSIDKGLELAGRTFEEDCQHAGVILLKATDYERPVISGGQPADLPPIDEARWDRINRALLRLGRPDDHTRKITWHVLAMGGSLRSYAERVPGLHGQAITAFFVAGLVILADFYRIER